MIESEGRAPLILDLGTGLRFFGLAQPTDVPFRGTALVSHLHWDHIQGIPFFTPLLREGSQMDLYGPVQKGRSLEETVRSFIHPPYFPVSIDELPGKVVFHEVLDDVLEIEGAKVTVAPVPHCGETLGFRVECDGASVAYVSDHQQPGPDSVEIDPRVLELCRDVDLLIHDSQYDRDEFLLKSDWGHCTFEYAVEVAAQSGAKRLALFHHDPDRSDAQVEDFAVRASELALPRGVEEVFAASEGMTLSLGVQAQG
ncbi:MAG: MBL fold metallo-hydrolase [Microthrixaceae bacterium]